MVKFWSLVIFLFSILIILIFINSTLFDKIIKNSQKKKEKKNRIKYPEYWAAYDYAAKCARELNQAKHNMTELKKQIDLIRSELIYLPKTEANKIINTKLYRLRKAYFYSKGKVMIAKEEYEKAQIKLKQESENKKSK